MAFGELNMAKVIALNAPKYKNIIEPFGDGGTLAFYPGKKKPKEHLVNFEDENIFNIMTFLQNITPADKKNLKSRDWIGNPENFDTAVSISATEGVDFFYKYFYLKHFSEKQKDKEAAPKFDWLKFGKSAVAIIYAIPKQKGFLKKVTLVMGDPKEVINKASGAETYLVLTPKKPEHIDFINSKINGISASYFYATKSLNNDTLFENVKQNPDKNVTTANASTIMVATMQVVTNYSSRLIPIDLQLIGYKK